VHEQKGVKLAEIVDGDDAEREVVLGYDIEAALVRDRIEQAVCITFGRLPAPLTCRVV
jgi:hypothetical protein